MPSPSNRPPRAMSTSGVALTPSLRLVPLHLALLAPNSNPWPMALSSPHKNSGNVSVGVGPCGQSISNTRPSRFVILSASFGSLSGERSKARAQDDTREAASFDSQRVLVEMYWPQGPQPHIPATPAPTRG